MQNVIFIAINNVLQYASSVIAISSTCGNV